MAVLLVQALGPVALVSLLLNDGLSKAIPGSDVNENPNLPEDPELQAQYNRAAVQVYSAAPMNVSAFATSSGPLLLQDFIEGSGLRDWCLPEAILIVQVSILVAILYLVLGTLRLGFLCNMLSKPIISAFLTAGAIIISTSQVIRTHSSSLPSTCSATCSLQCCEKHSNTAHA